MVDAVLRAGTRLCIISDNAAAVNNLQAIFATAGTKSTWNANDECEDYWDCIAKHIHRAHLPPHHHAAKWGPSHLDDPKK